MNMSIVKTLVYLSCLSFPCTIFAADVTLDDVRLGYETSLSSIEPIWTRCLFSKTYESETPETGRSSVTDDTVEWAREGTKFHFSWLASNTTIWFSSTGKVSWELDYPLAEKGGDPRRVRRARQQNFATKTDSRVRIYTNPGMWLGLYLPVAERVQSGDSVTTMLQKPSATLVGAEMVDQHSCLRVDLVYRRLDDKEVPVHVWFDPGVGVLPRRIEMNSKSSTTSYFVEEFKRLENASFPAKMRKDIRNKTRPDASSTQTLLLQEATLGKPLNKELFVPKLEDDIPTFNMDRKKDRLAWQDFLAGETPEKKQARIDVLLEEVRNRPPPAELPSGLQPAVDAVPRRFPWTMIFLVVGISLLTLAGIRMRS